MKQISLIYLKLLVLDDDWEYLIESGKNMEKL